MLLVCHVSVGRVANLDVLQTNCRSMIEAFAAGGDFHSRTAMGMYQHVADAVKSGEVLLELDDAAVAAAAKPGAKKPALLKNVFASERRKAKVA
jgi:DNA polymerase I